MRVTQPERQTGLYYVGIQYNAGGVGPHALVQRASYTVPAGFHVRIDGASVTFGQQSSPTVGDIIQAYIDDGTRDLIGIVWADLTTYSQPPAVAIGFAGYAGPGAGFRIFTSDASAGSSVWYRIALRLTVLS